MTNYNTICKTWSNKPGMRDARCICPKCRAKRQAEKKDITVSERMDIARETLKRREG